MTFVKTALFHKAGEGSGGGGGGGDQHNLGWYATESALTTAHATATDGDWAIVGATDTVWVWDSDTTAWKDTGAAGIELPDQTGHSGEFLTTDGTNASWSDKPLVNTSTNSQVSYAIATGYPLSSADTTLIGGAGGNYTGCVSIGSGAQAQNNYAVVIGSSARAGNYSVALGRGARATAANSIQINAGTLYQTNSDANTFKVANVNGNYEIMSADGTIPTARFTTDPSADGTYYPTLTISSGTPTRSWSTISALQNTATQSSSLGIGTTNPVTTYHSVVIGTNATNISGSNIAIGEYAKADGVSAISICPQDSGYTAKDNSIIIGGTLNPQKYQVRVGSTRGSTYEPGYGSIVLGTYQFDNTSNAGDGEVWMCPHTKSGIYDSPHAYKLMDADGTIPTARLTKVNSTITLTAAGWSSNTQTVTVTGMTTTGVVWVSPDPTDQAAYTSAGILCTAQAADSLTFTCSTTPSADIDVNVVML